MSNTIEEVAAFDGRIAKVCGAARTGKTESLVKRCATLLERGVDPSEVIVLVTSGFAAQAFRERLAAAAGDALAPAAARVQVSTVLDACVAILDTPRAREHTGRVPRLLSKHEYNFLLEDIKTSGTSARRLRNMLGYIYRQLSANAPQSSWCVGEEQVVYEMLLSYLKSEGAMLTQEAPALAVSYLSADAASSLKRPYVLCDDFQNLSAAEQSAACLMAKTQLIVAGNVNQTVAQASPYPNPKGFADFDTHRRGVEVFTLELAFGNPKALAFAEALCKFGDMDAQVASSPAQEAHGCKDIQAVKWLTPEDELNNLTKYLRLQCETAGEEVFESRTCVVVANKRWGSLMAKALAKRGFATTTCGVSSGIGGDPRYLERSRSLIAYTRLNLLADPDDMVAWRCWCGFGNYLTNSDAWSGLLEYAQGNDLTLAEALDKAGNEPKEPFIRANVLVERWVKGKEFIAKNSARKGFALLRAIDAEACPEFADISEQLVGDEDAAEIFERMRRQVDNPEFPDDPHILRIVTETSMSGCDYDNVVFCGFVDGFFPKREAFEVVSTDQARQAVMNRERRLFYNAASKARNSLLLSFFSKSPLELAEQTKMQVARVKSEDGERMGLLRPSAFLTEAGAEAPVTQGGQALMAALDSEQPQQDGE